ncbi:MAG: sigma-54-dependent Fis family transcriptional regulator [Planctomycetaceae bacterium]|nr:sigma-54-dependent Fis family transcriptional regulator [Planctomycetaceae bacterium]
MMVQGAEQLLEELLAAAAQCGEPREFLEQVFGQLCARLDVEAAELAVFERGQWRREAQRGEQAVAPHALLADALDAEQVLVRDGWVAAPLTHVAGVAAVLAVRTTVRLAPERAGSVARVAAALAAGWKTVHERARQRRRIQRLEFLLGITAHWGETLEMDTLLAEIAEASTRLLGAERASVFLWDRQTKTLVGRPALGVQDGELRIPEDAGIVGKVIRTGQPQRVDRESGQQEIDRRVDQQLGFETRTLLCVPLRGRGGKLFGAFELINKRSGNFTDEDQTALAELAAHAAVVLENTQQYEQLLKTRNQMADDAAASVQLVGHCPAIEALRSTVARVADTDLAVLILGENGTGKEVVARSIHYMSRRRHDPFVAVNCAALTETLLESELFGHEKGAFTDAHERRIGKFELASGGTLFLDEIGDMSLGGQAKLLRVLEEKLVVRVGGSNSIHTDARVLAATNQQLAELVRQKRFREDLYFRLNVVTLELPPLRDRGDDILLLANQFLEDFSRQARRAPPRLTAAARKRMLSHAWPGNVRELRNLMERIAYLTSGDKVDADELAFIMSPRGDESAWLPSDMSLADATRAFQIQFIQKQIQRAQGNMTCAAERLGLHRANLYRKMRQLGVTLDPQSPIPPQ